MKQKVKIIAEIAQAHDGSLGILHSYIDALADTGIDIIKFQTHIAEAESSPYEQFRVNFSFVDKTRFDYWKRMEFSLEQWKGIKQHCEDKGLEFMSSPFSNKAVDYLEEIGVKQYKVGSGEVSNLLLLNRIANTRKPVILSSGLSDWKEMDQAVNLFKNKNSQVSILQCTTQYPTTPENWGLNILKDLKERYNIPIGFSDHSGTPTACIAAASLGAEILEYHVAFDKKMFGPDATSSLTISEVKQLVDAVRQIEIALQNPIKKEIDESKLLLKTLFGKSLAINQDLKKGETIKIEFLEGKKPGDKGISASDYQLVIGKKLTRDKQQWEFINKEDFE
jgi:N,N'-diacetyllegionaminate synthase